MMLHTCFPCAATDDIWTIKFISLLTRTFLIKVHSIFSLVSVYSYSPRTKKNATKSIIHRFIDNVLLHSILAQTLMNIDWYDTRKPRQCLAFHNNIIKWITLHLYITNRRWLDRILTKYRQNASRAPTFVNPIGTQYNKKGSVYLHDGETANICLVVLSVSIIVLMFLLMSIH